MIKRDKYYTIIVITNFKTMGGVMSRKLVFSIFLLLLFFQVSCVSQPYRPNTHIKIHDSNTVYGVNVLGESRSFTKGRILSARDVQIEWEDSAKEGGEKLIRSSATEFLVEPDVGKPFLFVQYNMVYLRCVSLFVVVFSLFGVISFFLFLKSL